MTNFFLSSFFDAVLSIFCKKLSQLCLLRDVKSVANRLQVVIPFYKTPPQNVLNLRLLKWKWSTHISYDLTTKKEQTFTSRFSHDYKKYFFLKRLLEPARVAKLLNKVFCLQTPCSNYPCKNGGKCVPNYIDDHYHCDCTAGFSGDLCQTGEFHRSRKPRCWSYSNAREKLKLSYNYSKQIAPTLKLTS